MTTVAIVGGGFSGTMITRHLVELNPSIHILLFNSDSPLARGVAYSAYSSKHFLNVMAGKMSALPDQPDHFVDWLLLRPEFLGLEKELVAKTYQPRTLYGLYLEFVWKETQALAGKRVVVHNTRVVDVRQKKSFEIVTEDGGLFQADWVVLATGNEAPRNVRQITPEIVHTQRYFRNPWSVDSVRSLNQGENVLIIGNGLTMVDTVLGLKERGQTGTIYSISPNGFSILPHRHNGVSYSGLVAQLKTPYHLPNLVSLFMKHVKVVRKLGLSAEPVIDSVRPLTRTIWQALSLNERLEFMSRLRHLWGVARHRLPIHIYDQIIRLKLDQQLIVTAGRVESIEKVASGFEVTYVNRKTKQQERIQVSRIINCTGPETDVSKSGNTLLATLAHNKMITRDELGLGIKATPAGFVMCSDGTVNNRLLAIGNLMKGVLWESTAVPELRVDARSVAQAIADQISNSQGKSNVA